MGAYQIIIKLTHSEAKRRDQVLMSLTAAIQRNEPILLPRSGEHPSFSGTAGEFRYQFDAEEDLLHLAITRIDGNVLKVEEAQRVVATILPDFPPALIWLKPADQSQHFYLGQDELVASLKV